VAKKKGDRKGELFTIDGKEFICLDERCTKYEYFPKTGKLNRVVKEKCEPDVPLDPDLPMKLAMIQMHQRKMKGHTYDVIPASFGDDGDDNDEKD
jgi:hypothetical protein